MSDAENIKVLKGTVKWFNDAKGFGFIEHTSGKDVFVHYSVIDTEGFKTLKDGEEVEYQLHDGPKGMHALKVIRTKAPSVTGLAGQIEVVSSASSASMEQTSIASNSLAASANSDEKVTR